MKVTFMPKSVLCVVRFWLQDDARTLVRSKRSHCPGKKPGRKVTFVDKPCRRFCFARCQQEPIDEERGRVERRRFSLCIRSYIWPALTSTLTQGLSQSKVTLLNNLTSFCFGNPLLITGKTILQRQRIIFRN